MCGKHCTHEFHISNANDEPTHVVTFGDNLQKPILICDSCATFYDEKSLVKFSKVYSKSLLKVGGGSLKGSPSLLPTISRKLRSFLQQILVNM